MTATLSDRSSPDRSDQSSEEADTVDMALVEDFRWATGSYFMGLFAVALFDQAMHPAVSAALEATGRIREAGVARGLRSAASEQLANWADDTDRESEMQRLKDMHKVVKGIAPDGQRYSALTPETWNLILVSTIRMYLNAYEAISGRSMPAAEQQEAFEYALTRLNSLQLPGRSAVPSRWEEACSWYDELVSTTLTTTPTLAHAFRTVRRPERPDFLPPITQPAWWLLRPLAGHVLLICGLGITHPDLRAVQGVRWGRAQRAQFATITTAVRIANQTLPRRLTMAPLAHNRWSYERLVAKYRAMELDSFTP